MTTSTGTPLVPGSTIGILGGGQLGRMMAIAAGELGLKCHIYCPDAQSPAFDVASAFTCAPYEDEAALSAFADSVDVVTYEFENVPGKTASVLGAKVPVRPNPDVLKTTQDRLIEKTFLVENGFAVPPFAKVGSVSDLQAALAEIGAPAVLKTRTLGYDGKGQTVVDAETVLTEALDAIGNALAILEAFIDLACEVSVIAARGVNGDIATYDIAENVHENHILRTTTVPASVSPELMDRARAIGHKVAEELDYIGVLAVELFVTGDGKLLVNEIAPRVHNSGHWTQDACLICQFEQHIRAVAGWPLGSTERHSDVVMTNLLGDEAENWTALAAEPGARFHDYCKREARPGRKMGHINRLLPPESGV
ncbi:MAG: 5-(carboxyamino)imidazole ribonucleotide synthase [Hyphomicrobiales bacterium]